MASISLCMIVKNEEDVLSRCLDTVCDLVDEIIIVDTGSTDKTKEIAQSYGAKIFDFEWVDDFSAARNFSFSKATKDYIFWIDADDVLLPEDREKLRNLEIDPAIDMYLMPYNYAQDEYGNSILTVTRERLIKRGLNLKWMGWVHECLPLAGNIKKLDIQITHKKMPNHTDRNLKIYRKHLDNGEIFNVRDTYYYAKELFDNNYFKDAKTWFKKFLDMPGGWVEDKITACLKRGECFVKTGDTNLAKESFLKCLDFDLEPRGEMCCSLGHVAMIENKPWEAIYWYEQARSLKIPKNNHGLFNPDKWTWLPNLQLCVLYNQRGDIQKAFKRNEEALQYRPRDERMLSNRRILSGNQGKSQDEVIFYMSYNKQAAQTRIRGINVVEALKRKGAKVSICDLGVEDKNPTEIAVFGKDFNPTYLNKMKELKNKGVHVVLDVCEDILLEYEICQNMLELADFVVVCSNSLKNKISMKNITVIEDGWE